VPDSVQLRAQHSRAALTSGLLLFILARAQQSILPAIGHSLSPECMGTPASVLPAVSRRRNRAVSLFRIADRRLYGAAETAVKINVLLRQQVAEPEGVSEDPLPDGELYLLPERRPREDGCVSKTASQL
jgi:hypothetical protein